MRHTADKRSFALGLAAIASVLTLVACEVGEMGDDYAELEEAERLEALTSPVDRLASDGLGDIHSR